MIGEEMTVMDAKKDILSHAGKIEYFCDCGAPISQEQFNRYQCCEDCR